MTEHWRGHTGWEIATMTIVDAEEIDVLILGAGLSGINAGYRVGSELPDRSYAILEARDIIGGTWSFWKYPGFRCDAAMTNFGFAWHPWPHDKKIIEGEPIVEYIQDAVKTHGIDKHIRFKHRVESSDWDSTESKWIVTVDAEGQRKVFKAGWLLMCTGYYAYDKALETHIPGIDSFRGTVAHPQWWPEDLDWAGKKVVIIGSGATTWTLFPTMAKTAAHTTVLQRSPSYVFALPTESRLDQWLKVLLPLWLAHWIASFKDLVIETLFVTYLLTFPGSSRKFLTNEAKKQLPEDYPVDVHFNPSYNPFEQRLCMAPDGDVFKTLHQANAEIVTDHIDKVTADGIHTTSGRFLPADIIVTATGLHVQLFGTSDVSVDGKPVNPGEHYIWRGCMLDGIPNAAAIIGYVAATWTPGADAVSRIAIKVMKQSHDKGALSATPVLAEKEREGNPRDMAIDAKSNYFLRAKDRMPISMGKGPWYGRKNVVVDRKALYLEDLSVGLDFHVPEKTKDE